MKERGKRDQVNGLQKQPQQRLKGACWEIGFSNWFCYTEWEPIIWDPPILTCNYINWYTTQSKPSENLVFFSFLKLTLVSLNDSKCVTWWPFLKTITSLLLCFRPSQMSQQPITREQSQKENISGSAITIICESVRMPLWLSWQQDPGILGERVLQKGQGSISVVIRPALLAGHLKTSTELDCLPVKYFI